MLIKKIILSILLFISAGYINAKNMTGDVRGVTFFFLDGWDSNSPNTSDRQDFIWVLNNLENPTVRGKIDNLLVSYRAAGVNWIRILVSADHMPVSNYPMPSQDMIDKVNKFFAITRAGQNEGKFTIEVVLMTPVSKGGSGVPPKGHYSDIYPFNTDKVWLSEWLRRMDYTNLGMVFIAGDASPCGWISSSGVRCEGDSGVLPLNKNHGEWIKEVWQWTKANFPQVNIGYEMIGMGGDNLGSTLLSRSASWANMKTPEAPTLGFSLYFKLAPGSPWTAYASKTQELLNAYKSATTKLLWIDEYGLGKCNVVSQSCQHTEADMHAYYDGLLAASTCFVSDRNPKFAWVAGRDYPYDNTRSFGLVSSFSGNTPQWLPSWDSLSLYYNVTQCP